uniref:Putative MFS-type transporter YbfB n=1 Tax=Thermosporothrix sp. COM3 TaxID=2490863 RepID=A0A455SJB9_9CHLR|nr:putative MFS-type transporter YbfB [Thermosporothrix sp. COM3]
MKSLKRLPIHYAWILLFLCFLGLLMVQGVRLSFGAFVQPWERSFATNRETISLISMVSFVFYGLSQPLVGRLADLYGLRIVFPAGVFLVGGSLIATTFASSPLHLVLLFGGMGSIGFGATSYVAVSAAITRWFHTRRGIAFGVMEAGVSAGQLVLVPVALFAVTTWGWQRFLFWVGLLLCLIVCPLLYFCLRSSPAEIGMRPYGEVQPEEQEAVTSTEKGSPLPWWRILATWPFWGLALPFFVCGVTTTGLMDTHLISYAHDHGFSTATVGVAVSLLAAFNIIGSLASGPLADIWDGRWMLALFYGVRALSLVLLLNVHHPFLLLLFSVIFGLVDFATVAPTQTLASHYFPSGAAGFVFGLLSLFHQLGSALGAYLPGLLYDWTGSYILVFSGAIALLVLATVINILLPPFKRGASLPAVELERG